jgi:hypothetical protein
MRQVTTDAILLHYYYLMSKEKLQETSYRQICEDEKGPGRGLFVELADSYFL